LRELDRQLKDVASGTSHYRDWIVIPPLAPDVEAKAAMQAMDVAIVRHLHHLQEVCHFPRTHLKFEDERLPVSRARRISQRAPEYLASHSEDWRRRKLTSVVPKRILASVPEELYDFYENRMAVRLVDRLERYLRERIADLRHLKAMFEFASQIKPHATPRWFNRVCQLLGESVRERGEGAAKRTLETLIPLYYQVVQLFDSALYRAIPRHVEVPPTPRATNMLSNDRHYRYVGILWRSWLEHAYRRPPTPVELYAEQQELCSSFERFANLLVLRALNQLGFYPSSTSTSSVIKGGAVVRFHGSGGFEIALRWENDGTHSISSGGQPRARFVPLPSAITKESDERGLQQKLDHLVSMVATRLSEDEREDDEFGEWHFILYPGDLEQRDSFSLRLQNRAQSLGNDLAAPSKVGLVPVSTYEINSVERVARALRWVLWGGSIMSYPPTVPPRPSVVAHIPAPWLSSSSDERAEAGIVRRPLREEYVSFQREKANLAKRGSRYRDEIRRLEEWLEKVNTAAGQFDQWLTCPLCGHENTDLEHRKDGHFVCRCEKCGAEWGTRACGECGGRYPFIAPPRLPEPALRKPGWIDRFVGMDVLAVPCWAGDGGDYICPWCGKCRNAGKASCASCARCSEDGEPVLEYSARGKEYRDS
jgi:hypothetical protein